jgi:uncharacterized membrane protein
MSVPAMSPEERLQSLKNVVTLAYALYAVALFSGITLLIAVVVDYVKRDDAAGTWLESHLRWQIRTFWFTLLWGAIGALTWIILIGWFILAATCVWYIYRIVKGWLRLNDNKPMYASMSPIGG